MKFPLILAGAVFAASSASALTFNPVFTYVGNDSSNPPQSTGVYKADLTGFPLLTEIASISIKDDNSGTSGSPGAYSGFDLDALFLDVDGDYTTTGDQFYANSYVFTAGSIRPTGDPQFASNTSGPLNGMNADGTVNEAFATLNAIDAIFFSTGSISLGDGGSLSANFAPAIPVAATLFLITGEVGDNGEGISATITVSDEPAVVPLPAAAWLLLGGLGVMGAVSRKRKPSSRA